MKEFVVRPDTKGRICIGKMAHGVSSFKAIFDEESHKIVLEPYIKIPYREKWLFENKEALKRVLDGMKESLAGKPLIDAGSFSQYIEKDKN
jgi:hypothetical protein